MPHVHKTAGQAREHLSQAVANIPTRYKEAVAKADWEGPATSDESEDNYRAGLAEAQAADRRRAKIREAGNAKYQRGAAEKGAAVIGTRITAALADYERHFSPILAAMNSASDSAPPRTRDYRTNVTNRLIPVIEAARRAAGKE